MIIAPATRHFIRNLRHPYVPEAITAVALTAQPWTTKNSPACASEPSILHRLGTIHTALRGRRPFILILPAMEMLQSTLAARMATSILHQATWHDTIWITPDLLHDHAGERASIVAITDRVLMLRRLKAPVVHTMVDDSEQALRPPPGAWIKSIALPRTYTTRHKARFLRQPLRRLSTYQCPQARPADALLVVSLLPWMSPQQLP